MASEIDVLLWRRPKTDGTLTALCGHVTRIARPYVMSHVYMLEHDLAPVTSKDLGL